MNIKLKHLYKFCIALGAGVVLSSCLDHGGSNLVGSSNTKAVDGLTAPIVKCKEAEAFEIEGDDYLEKGSEAGLRAYLICDGGTVKLDVTSKSYWKSSNHQVVSIDNDKSKGTVKAVAAGTAKISAEFSDPTLGVASIDETKEIVVKETLNYCSRGATMIGTEIQPTLLTTLPLGGTKQLSMYALCSDGNNIDVTGFAVWGSSNNQVASISNTINRGLITAKAEGDTTITATIGGTPVYEHVIKVSAAIPDKITADFENPEFYVGDKNQIKVFAYLPNIAPTDVSSKAIYTVLKGAISVEGNGVVLAKAAGAFSINISYNGKDVILSGHISNARVVKIEVSNANELVLTPYIKTIVEPHFEATYSDGSKQALSGSEFNCSITNDQATIGVNEGRCSFYQIDESEVTANVTYKYKNNNDISGGFNVKLDNSKIASVELVVDKPKAGVYMTGDSVHYTVNLHLADNNKVDVTKIILLTIKDGEGAIHSDKLEKENIYYESKKELLLLDPKEHVRYPITVSAQVGNKSSNVVKFDSITSNSYTLNQINALMVTPFKQQIKNAIQNGQVTFISGTQKQGSKAENVENIQKLDDLRGFFINSKNGMNDITITPATDNDFSRVSGSKLYKIESKDPNFKVFARVEHNVSNGDKEVILSEFCNDSGLNQSFSSANITKSWARGFAWSLSEKIGLGYEAGVKLPGGDVKIKTDFDFGSSQSWNNSEASTYGLGGASPLLPPHTQMLLVSTVSKANYFIDANLPVSFTGGDFPVVFYVHNPKNKMTALAYVRLHDIYESGNASVDKLIDRFGSNNSVYISQPVNVFAAGETGEISVTHALFEVHDPASKIANCIYPNASLQLTSGNHSNSSSKVYSAREFAKLQESKGYEFLKTKPKFLSIQK